MATGTSIRRVDGGRIKGAANVPSCIEIMIVQTLPNQKAFRNVIHGSFAVVPPDMQVLANNLWASISNAWQTDLAAVLDVATTINSVHVRNMTVHTNPVFMGTGTALHGTDATGTMPVNNAIVLTENVAARGKGLKGRLYLGGFGKIADGGTGTISEVAQTAVSSYGTALFGAVGASNLTPCVAQVARQDYTGLSGAVIPQRNAGTVQVTSYSLKDILWDTQRRRGQG